MAIELSIIICTYNRKLLLKNCLDALIEQLLDMNQTTEVILVDNNSLDGTAEMIKNLYNSFSWLRYVKEEKLGLSNARNCGAEHAQGEYLCYLDDDAKPNDRYLSNLYDLLRSKRPDIAGGPMYPYYTSKRPRWFKDEFEIRKNSKVSGYCTNCNITGANFIIRAALLRELGMFSPKFGMTGNKTRLGEEKAILEHYRNLRPISEQRVYYSLECFIYHHVPPAKMRLSYIIKRGFFSGVSLAQIKKYNFQSFFGISKIFFRYFFLEFLFMLISGRRRENDHPVLAIQRSAVAIGQIFEIFRNAIVYRLGKHL